MTEKSECKTTSYPIVLINEIIYKVSKENCGIESMINKVAIK